VEDDFAWKGMGPGPAWLWAKPICLRYVFHPISPVLERAFEGIPRVRLSGFLMASSTRTAVRPMQRSRPDHVEVGERAPKEAGARRGRQGLHDRVAFRDHRAPVGRSVHEHVDAGTAESPSAFGPAHGIP